MDFLKKMRGEQLSIIVIYQNMVFWDLNMVIQLQTLIPSQCGKPNLVTLQMDVKSLLIIICLVENQNGLLRVGIIF